MKLRGAVAPLLLLLRGWALHEARGRVYTALHICFAKELAEVGAPTMRVDAPPHELDSREW